MKRRDWLKAAGSAATLALPFPNPFMGVKVEKGKLILPDAPGLGVTAV